MDNKTIATLIEDSIGSNERIRRIFDSSELAIWYRDIETDSLWISKGLAAIYGFNQEDFTDWPTRWRDSVYPEDRLIIDSAINQQIIGFPTDIGYRIICSNGEVKWLRDQATPILDDKGKVIAISGTIHDITEHKKELMDLQNQLTHNNQIEDIPKERELFYGYNNEEGILGEELHKEIELARKELYETIRHQQGMIFKFKKIHNAFIHTLCDGELLYRLGLKPGNVVGKEVSDFLPEKNAKMAEDFYRKAWDREEDITYEDGMNGIAYLVALRPIKRNNKVVEVIGSLTDITARKKAEIALIESENKYRLIAENMTDLIIIFDQYGNTIYASPSHLSVLGYPSDYFVNNKTLHLIHPDDLSATMIEFEKAMKIKTPVKIELRLLHAAGNWKLFEFTGTPLLTENGEVDHLMVVAKDITEKKHAEELLLKSEKLSLVGELAAGVAHEIRNPLTSIKGFIQLFQQGVRNDEYFQVILSEFNRVEDIIKEFLSLAKPQEIQLKKVSITKLLKEIETLLESETILKNIDFTLDIDPETPWIMCDPNQIKQVLLNLCKNSIEAIDTNKQGMLKITVQIENDTTLLIQVIDNGIGINEDRIKRLGEPFFSNKEKGTGLGLMLCFRIIKEHKGSITFESIENEGTTANVRLPLVL